METRRLGETDQYVTKVCLGTMTFGEQNTEEEAFEQLDLAIESGINFIDTAEMYPVPPRAETVHRTETMVGRWLKDRGGRDAMVLATKVTGRAAMPWIRGGPRLSREHIAEALDGSLRRLGVDCVDLYQLHWPDRTTNFFGKLGYEMPSEDDGAIAFEETLRALDDAVRAGKVRHVGLSNETPYGVMKFRELAQREGLPAMVSIQNPYSLLNRTFEVGLAEIAIRESIGLLAYSPMAFGVLSGKYLDGARPEGARLTLFGDHFTRYLNPLAVRATERYVAIAREAGLDPAQMSLAYVTTRPFTTSNIIGARTVDQLRANIEGAQMTLPEDVLRAIDEVHAEIPNPAP